eukprot:s2340_g11.t1
MLAFNVSFEVLILRNFCRSDNFIQLQHRYQLQDAKEIATHLLQSLEIFLTASASKKGAPGAFNISIAQALPSDVLVKLGETHLADSEVITPLCTCIATSSREYRDDFVNAGTVAIPLRVFDQAEVHTPQACASSASLLKELLIESRRAASQFMDAGGPRLILKVLSAQAALSLFRLLKY